MSVVKISTTDGKQMPVYEVRSSDPQAPALILIQEIFGVNSSMRQLAHNWAKRGFNVWCPDLFFRAEPGLELNPANEAQFQLGIELMQDLDIEQSLKDLESAREQLTKKLGHSTSVAVGYCMGGRLVVQMAAQSPIKAAISYYGVNLETIIPPLEHTAPVLLHIADQDKWVQGEARETILAEAKQRNGWESYIYENCDHAFARPSGQHYVSEADQLAVERSMAFLSAKL